MGRILLPEIQVLHKGQFTPVPENTLHMRMGSAGLYRCQVTKARTGKPKYDSGWFKNIITDRGLVEYWTLPSQSFGDAGSLGANCCVGTGNTTPNVTDVQLANYIASAGGTTGGTNPGPNATGYVAQVSVVGQPDYVPPYWYARYIYQFGTGAAAGNLTEVGVYPGGANYAADLFSRALILDGSGNPTAITVLSDEILTVTWELRWYLDVTDHVFSFNVNGSPKTGTYRLSQASQQRANTRGISNIGGVGGIGAAVTLYSGAIVAPLTGLPTGTLGTIDGNHNPMSIVQFVNDLSNSGTCYYDVKGTFPTGVGTGTIASFVYTQHMFSYQFGNLSAPILKTSGQQLQVNFRGSWGRYP